MRRIFCLAIFATVLCVPGGAVAASSGGAGVPRTARQVLDGGGAVYTPAPAKRKSKRKRKPAGRAPAKRRPGPRTPSGAPGYHFPVAGTFTWGEAGARFGAPRSGHTHQGQDLVAAEGTPVLAPHAGVVQTVQYQASGGGHYVVLDGDGEDRDYVFMHMRSGSIPVREGQHVSGGARLGEVGNTGRSFGAHLHFEIWTGGGWYTGGHPIDPLPLLRSWIAR